VGGVITGSSTSVTGTTTTGGTTTSAGYISQTQSTNVMSRMSLVNSVRNWSISNYGNQFSPNGSFNIADETGAAVRLSITTDGNFAVTGNLTASGILSATGNVQGGNLRTAGLISATGNISGGNLSGTLVTGTITTAAQPNITSVGTLTSLNVGAQTNTGLITGYSSTNTDVNTANDGGSFSARGNSTTIASMTFHRTGAYAINMGLGTDNVFRIGGWSASNNCMQLSGAGAMTILSSLTLNSANGVTAIVNGGSNGVGNIGSSTSVFNTVFAKATSAQYADVAEKYTADKDYPVGTVLRIGGQCEVSQTNSYHATNIVGTVSDKPAYVMNSGLAAEHVAVVALLGRVPCRVTGTISKGDLLVSSKMPGVATVLDPDLWVPGCVMGKALEDYDSTNEGTIEIVVGRS
jgi:hypothetical protein